MNLLTIDFETYYDKEYSLRKQTTEEYIRDSRFEIIGVTKKINKQPGVWFSGTHREIQEFLDKDIDWDNTRCLAHNAAFDGAILSWVLDRRPAFWFDTLSMARPKHLKTIGVSLAALVKHYNFGAKGYEVHDALGKRRQDFTPQEMSAYAGYCLNDTDLCFLLFKELLPETSELELKVINHTVKMFTEPKFRLNKAVLEQYLEELIAKKKALLDRVGGEDKLGTFMSNPQFAQMLIDLGVEPPMKTSPTTGKPTYAFAKTDKGLKDLLEHPSEEVQAVVACRLGVKSTIEETRTRALIGIAERGPMPVMLNYWGAGTGRFSGGDGINPQNLKRGGKIRRAIEAPAGCKVITSDLSQIEARILALVSGQQDLLEAFAEGRDVYSEFATMTYGREITKADKMERFVGKTCILGLGYYTGKDKLRETLRIGNGGISVNISVEEADRIVKLYRQQNHKVVSFWRACDWALKGMLSRRQGYVVEQFNIRFDGHTVILPNGAILRYPALEEYTDPQTGEAYYRYLNRNKWTKIYSGLLCENIVQALARGVIVEYMDKIAERYGVALQVHDEIVSVVRDALVPEARMFIEHTMSTPVSWLPGLPVACEVGVGPSYGEAK